MKSGNKELASKKLDDDMDAYWAKKGGEGEAEADAAGAAGGDDAAMEGGGGEEKPAAVEAAAGDAEA